MSLDLDFAALDTSAEFVDAWRMANHGVSAKTRKRGKYRLARLAKLAQAPVVPQALTSAPAHKPPFALARTGGVLSIPVLGVDPAFRNLGLAPADILIHGPDRFEIRPRTIILATTTSQAGKAVRKSSDDLRAARDLRAAFMGALDGMAFVVAEVPHGSQSARASLGAGICLGLLATCPIPVIEVSEAEVKQASIGQHDASKRKMIEWAAARHPQLPWRRATTRGVQRLIESNEHLADACAALEAGIRTEEWRRVAMVAWGLSQ